MSRVSKEKVPLKCGICDSRNVSVIKNAERALIRCEDCGERLFSYYTDPARRDIPPRDGDPFLLREVERGLLKQVGPLAQALYEYLCRYIQEYDYAPTLREIQAALGWKSPNTVSYYLNQLEEAGLIERDFATSRGIRLVHVA